MLAALGKDVVALRERFAEDMPDVEIFENLKGTKTAFVSQDNRTSRVPAARAALKRSGITCLFVARFYSKLTFWDQAVWFVKHFPTIESFVEGAAQGTTARVNQNGRSAMFEL